MFTKERVVYFLILLIPLFVVGALSSFAYEFQVHNDFSIDWPGALLITVVLDVFFTWWQNRLQKGGPRE